MEIIILDGRKMTAFDDLHDYLKIVMRFPAYYGRNLDALADCLSELGPHVTVILSDAETMKAGLGIYGDRLLRVFSDMSSERNSFNFVINE